MINYIRVPCDILLILKSAKEAICENTQRKYVVYGKEKLFLQTTPHSKVLEIKDGEIDSPQRERRAS